MFKTGARTVLTSRPQRFRPDPRRLPRREPRRSPPAKPCRKTTNPEPQPPPPLTERGTGAFLNSHPRLRFPYAKPPPPLPLTALLGHGCRPGGAANQVEESLQPAKENSRLPIIIIVNFFFFKGFLLSIQRPPPAAQRRRLVMARPRRRLSSARPGSRPRCGAGRALPPAPRFALEDRVSAPPPLGLSRRQTGTSPTGGGRCRPPARAHPQQRGGNA